MKVSQNKFVVFKLIMLVVASACAMLHAWADIFSIACRDEEARHIFLVPVVIAWLFWSRKGRSKDVCGRHYEWGLLLLAFSIFLHEYGLQNHISLFWHSSAVLCLIAGAWLALGVGVIRSYLPSVVALFFMVPVPGLIRQQISLPLQHASTVVTHKVLSTAGLDVARNGYVLSIDGVQVTVAEACNGMRMLFAIFLVVYTLVLTTRIPNKYRFLILGCSPLIAMCLNIVRLIITVAGYGMFEAATAAFLHDINGWLIPTVMVLLAMFVTERFRAHVDNRPIVLPPELRKRNPLLTGLGAAVMLMLFVTNSYRPPSTSRVAEHQHELTEKLSSVPYAIDNWVATDERLLEQELDLLKPVAAFRRVYHDITHEEDDNCIVMVAIVSGHARDLIGHEPGICMPGQGWTLLRQSPEEWQFDECTINGRNYLFEFPQQSQEQVASILLTPGGRTSGAPEIVAQAAADFRQEPFGAAAIQIASSQPRSLEQWKKITTKFVTAMLPVVKTFEQARVR